MRFVWTTILGIAIGILLVLLFQQKPAPVEIEVPGEIVIQYEPSPPDTTYITKYIRHTTLDTHFVMIEGDTVWIPSDEGASNSLVSNGANSIPSNVDAMLTSEKTFIDSVTWGEMESRIWAIGRAPVLSFKNTLTFTPNADYINKQIKTYTKRAEKKGMIMGAVGTSAVFLSIMLLSK